jgi:hypothetical protein
MKLSFAVNLDGGLNSQLQRCDLPAVLLVMGRVAHIVPSLELPVVLILVFRLEIGPTSALLLFISLCQWQWAPFYLIKGVAGVV